MRGITGKKVALKIFANAFEVKLHNRRFIIEEDDRGYKLFFIKVDDNPDVPATAHTNLRGKAMITNINLSKQALEAVVMGFHEYRKSKITHEMATQKNQKPKITKPKI